MIILMFVFFASLLVKRERHCGPARKLALQHGLHLLDMHASFHRIKGIYV
jgi:hypothetical protein